MNKIKTNVSNFKFNYIMLNFVIFSNKYLNIRKTKDCYDIKTYSLKNKNLNLKSRVNSKKTKKFFMKVSQNFDPEYEKEKARKEEIERLRAAEKFMEIDEGKFECQACGYVYEPEKGDRFAGIEPGTTFPDLPSDFYCPACRSPKTQFKNIKKVIAGFAENQQYGLGGNSLTGEQKNLVIFGILGSAFLLLLSGYLLE
ncbi:rubredoxin (nucleomorph) [Chroomonas mesostigmatica CCMP1168]|uniref:Rubredoxin n=1 Tax=Chroomonas mesostigmatica CCMP1168 TaxID=1195612 RepID=J7G1B9_9CRYP|nr:rubredoxin [Chroomonas mesostigmatica CCMP1168]|mmetsp:Transcript_25623/g.63136  ORF Transcript_25623/g.63136 Transcript_25623/m.63136 type:complete len:198 (+) Transcript_25623:754-1347(+)